MSGRPDETEQLTALLQALPTPEPSAEFVMAARRRYLEAMGTRDRRHVLIALAVELAGLAVIAALLGPAIEPRALVVWLAEAAADLARWMTGVGVVLALVPLSIWTSATLGTAVAVLSLVLAARAVALAK